MNGLKNKLIVLGVGATMATGISVYFMGNSPQSFITFEERDAIIEQYRIQMTAIKDSCDTDVRCVIEKGERRVEFKGVRTKKDVFDKLNLWIEEGNHPRYKR